MPTIIYLARGEAQKGAGSFKKSVYVGYCLCVILPRSSLPRSAATLPETDVSLEMG
jgi:hypothetical protein